ncbi:BET1 homolog isoform X2 [Venturia canescens]|uniref:BET1 homolog isoform X2 n=1 Tax=Venturia canescens TaxID=32260 RepID=UPI001C9D0CD6|nr:BET1 homolog isoform X2 [Venturia canescens]
MRRSHSAGYGYEPLPSSSSNALEEENERMAEELQGKIHALKSLSIDIGTEVKYQHKMLNDMDEDFEKTSGSLSSSVARVLRMAKAGHNCYILYLFLFSIGVFFVMWIIIKFK